MGTTQKAYQSHDISRQQFVSLFSELLGGNPNPEDTTPPGPWDPIIRKAWERIIALGPSPQPWRQIFGTGSWVESERILALGPHPEPWHQLKAIFAAAIAQEVIDRAGLMQEIADTLSQTSQQGIVVNGYLSRFIDDCGNDKLWRKRPFPPRRDEGDDKLTALELIVMGVTFEQGARTIANQQLQQEFSKAGASLTEAGIARK